MSAFDGFTPDELAEVEQILDALDLGYFPSARPEQHPPPADVLWKIWLIMSGRGYGKIKKVG